MKNNPYITNKVVLVLITFLIAQVGCRSANSFEGGFPATLDQFPATVALGYYDGNFFCGGVKVGPKHYLTAEHCLNEIGLMPGNEIIIYHGIDVFSERTEKIKVKIIRDRRHGTYKNAEIEFQKWTESASHQLSDRQIAKKRVEFHLPSSDIMLFEVDKETSWPIAKIDLKVSAVDEIVTVCGYGCDIDFNSQRGKLYCDLKKISEVNQGYLRIPIESAKDTESFSSLCKGDSGTPVYRKNSAGDYVVIAVNSLTDGSSFIIDEKRHEIHEQGLLTRLDDDSNGPNTGSWLRQAFKDFGIAELLPFEQEENDDFF